jgi:hypothetical protein
MIDMGDCRHTSPEQQDETAAATAGRGPAERAHPALEINFFPVFFEKQSTAAAESVAGGEGRLLMGINMERRGSEVRG